MVRRTDKKRSKQSMANRIEELRQKRLQFLFHLYKTVGGQRFAITNMWELGEELGFSKEEVNQLVDYLAADHLLKHMTFGGGISITHAGVVAVEDSYAELKELMQQVSVKEQVVQVPQEPRVAGGSQEGTAVRILFLGANPEDADRLRLEAEIREIDQALRQSDFRDRFDIRQHWAVRVSDVQELFLRHQPDIVHFSGHGSASNEIVLEDQAGNCQPVPVRALKGLFSVLKDNIRCVVLNACYSEQQAEAIAEHIDCVVGMSKAIGDAAAISFSAAFYRALGYARDVQTAFDLGCLKIDLESLDDQDVPRLLARRVSPAEIVFA
jgi:hypothetical protein